jgi:hypothetical protein
LAAVSRRKGAATGHFSLEPNMKKSVMTSQETLDILVASAGCVAIALHWLIKDFGLDTETVFKGMSAVACMMSAGFALGTFWKPRGR